MGGGYEYWNGEREREKKCESTRKRENKKGILKIRGAIREGGNLIFGGEGEGYRVLEPEPKGAEFFGWSRTESPNQGQTREFFVP
jgi:hypothetical protein